MRLRRVLGGSLVTGWAVALAMVLWAGCGSTPPVAAPDASSGAEGDAAADASADVLAPAPTDGGIETREGGCTAVKGPCDLVLQDCPDDATGKKRECVVTGSRGDFTTRCVSVQASQQLPMGRACCPGAGNPCLPGLTCVGDRCADGGPMTGRCTPACCAGDHASCGQSDPEGIGGRCDLTLYSGETKLHAICSYRARCKPFGLEPCAPSQLCMVEDQAGSASCISSEGKGLREPCTFANDCADGLFCAGPQGAATCRMICLRSGASPPFDTSKLDGSPGRGGCPSGETCSGPRYSNLPDWFQLCALPDGG